jgi:hypothetical protein
VEKHVYIVRKAIEEYFRRQEVEVFEKNDHSLPSLEKLALERVVANAPESVGFAPRFPRAAVVNRRHVWRLNQGPLFPHVAVSHIFCEDPFHSGPVRG